MPTIPNHTPKLNSNDVAKTDSFGEALWADYCSKRKVAEQANSLADAIDAGHAWARFIRHYEKSPGVSAGGSE